MSSKCGLLQSHLNSNCMGGLFLVLVWTTNGQLSQGQLNGRRGSSACTIVCILLAEMVSESSVLSLPHLQSLNKDWYFAVVKAINCGNSIYDKHVSALGTLLDVEDVSDLFKRKLDKHFDVSETKPVWLSQFTDPFMCTLMFNLKQFSLKRGKKFALFICKGSTVLIVGDGSGYVLVVDTHFHPDLSSGTVFIYGITCAVASYLSRKYHNKTCSVGTLTEVSFTVVID